MGAEGPSGSEKVPGTQSVRTHRGAALPANPSGPGDSLFKS